MEGSSSSGFDMSSMSTGDKLLAAGSILLLIFSFFPWQQACASDVVGDIPGVSDLCISFSMWSGSGSFAGVIAGLLTIALIIVGILAMSGSMASMNMGSLTPDKLTGFLGLGVAAFGLLKFLFALFNEVAWAAFVGLVLLVMIAYGAWQKVQTSGGFQMGGAGGGSMGGGMPPSSPPPISPPPSTPPPSTPPPSEPPGGAPPSSEM
jgi:hypothetical protein